MSSSHLIVAVFALGYVAIVLEHPLRVSKAASALLTGVACWTVLAVAGDPRVIEAALVQHMGEMSQLLFFLLGAMTIVELIDAHDGFDLITARIRTRSRRKLLVIIALLAFFLSAVLDNLTTSIVMMTLVRKLVGADTDRMVFGGIVIVAANAGGVWSPIGDVTTTMLWVGGNITTGGVVRHLLLPALVSVAVPLAWVALRRRGEVERGTAREPADTARATTPGQRAVVFAAGVGVLLFVPVFKTVTHLPPVMGILLGLGVLWTLTAIIHRKREDDEVRSALSVSAALQRVDAESVLFFLGILLAISALESAGVLGGLAHAMDRHIHNVDVITLSIGLASAVVDNVPLVAAAQAMYSPATFPTDHSFWVFLAYCAGTGGSILIIGSAAGIAVMGIQRITFGWYVRHMAVPALLGFAAGAVTYLALTG